MAKAAELGQRWMQGVSGAHNWIARQLSQFPGQRRRTSSNWKLFVCRLMPVRNSDLTSFALAFSGPRKVSEAWRTAYGC